MLDSSLQRIELHDSLKDYTDIQKMRRTRLWAAMLALLSLVLSILIVIRLLDPDRLIYAPLICLGAVFICVAPVVIWNEPRIGLYMLTLAACLFGQVPDTYKRDPFNFVPFFWNVSTMVEHYFGSRNFGFLHMNFGEFIMVMTGVFWLMREITLRRLKFHKGEFFFWLSLYVVWCGVGFIRGINNGGDMTFALWELRAQTYFFLAYILAANLITDRKHAMALLWMIAIGIGLKSLVGTANFIKNPNVGVDEGVLAHEDSLLMNVILLGALVLTLARVEPKLRWMFLCFVPFALLSSLANGRRAGIAAFLVAFPIVVVLCAVLLKERRKQLIQFMVLFAAASAIYLPIAWNGEGAWALPARAIRSQSSPNERDASSDYYRLSENINLKTTRDTSAYFGYGYGRPYLLVHIQHGRNDPFSRILPHNGVLWVWMRLGHVGFIMFWMLIATVLIRGPQLLKKINDPHLLALGVIAIAMFLMNIIYGKYDLTFANYRAMWLTGTLLGILAVLPRLAASQDAAANAGVLPATPQEPLPTAEDEDAEDEEPSEDGTRSLPRKGIGWTRGADW